ncbi:hypothetical protein [Microbulbifer sp. JTAC008]|uniref:hypothetical protein n=1 Tax=unclassified Microbulbifer TaxID=2619833 RepID=UPI00403A25D3
MRPFWLSMSIGQVRFSVSTVGVVIVSPQLTAVALLDATNRIAVKVLILYDFRKLIICISFIDLKVIDGE